jgi:hypothetical protein
MRKRLTIGVLILLSGISGRGLISHPIRRRYQASDIDMFEPRLSGSSLRTGDLATNPTTLSTLSIETKVPDHEVFRRRFPTDHAGERQLNLTLALPSGRGRRQQALPCDVALPVLGNAPLLVDERFSRMDEH